MNLPSVGHSRLSVCPGSLWQSSCVGAHVHWETPFGLISPLLVKVVRLILCEIVQVLLLRLSPISLSSPGDCTALQRVVRDETKL